MADQTGVMIALMIPGAVAEKLALKIEGALPSAELHVTLAYLGEVQDLPADGQAKALEAVKAVATEFEPISGKINGSGRFVNAETGAPQGGAGAKDAVYLNFDSPQLPELRAKLLESLKAAGLPAVENHGFSPHITLAYVDPGVELPKSELPSEAVTVGGLTLAWGGKMEEVKFGAPEAANKEAYPWEQCIADQTQRYGSEETAQRVCGMIRAKGEKMSMPTAEELAAIEEELKIQPKAETPAETPTSNKSIKAAGDWELDVLGVPFGGPDGGKDSDGQWFTARTNIHRESYPTIPVVYYHGLSPERRPMGEPEIIGKAQYLRVGPEGHWWHVVLDKGSKLAQRIWDAAKMGTARASSGTIDYLARMIVRGVKKMYDKMTPGEITNWPVAELTLIDASGNRQPANNYAVALPSAKSVFDRAGLNLPVIQPEPEPQGQGEESRSEGKDKDILSGGTKMALDAETRASIAQIVSETMLAEQAKVAAANKAAADQQALIAEAIKAAKAVWEAEAAKSRRLPMGMPHVNQYAATSKYDHLSAAELGLMIDTQSNIHAASPLKMAAVSPDAIHALMLKVARIENDKVSGDSALYAKSALKAMIGELSDDAIKAATDPMYSTGSLIGSDWVGTAYSNQLWEAIRAQAKVVPRIPTVVIPDGYSSEYFPLESTDPTWYKVAETTANDGTMKTPVATVTESQMATATKQITVGKMGARVAYTGELDEGSLIAFAPQLKSQLEKSGAENMEYVVIDGDTATSSNINDIGGTTYSGAATSLFLLTNGFRKSPLVTTTGQSRSAAGGFVAEDFLATLKLLGSNGIGYSDPTKCGLIVDPNVWFAAAGLPEAKDKNQSIFTVEGGFVTRAYLVEIIPSWFMHRNSSTRKANTAGKVDQDTAGNNAYGAIVGVRFDQWKLAYKRRMTMETTRFANSDTWEIVALTRWGLGQRDTLAAAETYYVGV